MATKKSTITYCAHKKIKIKKRKKNEKKKCQDTKLGLCIAQYVLVQMLWKSQMWSKRKERKKENRK